MRVERGRERERGEGERGREEGRKEKERGEGERGRGEGERVIHLQSIST